MIIGGSGSGKTKTLLNLINEQNVVDKIYLYAKYLSEPKHEILIENRQNVGIKHFNDPNAFIESSNTLDDVYENINDYNPSRKKNLNCFWWYDWRHYDKKFQAIMNELFIRWRKIYISLVFIAQSYFSVPKIVRLNSSHYLIVKINNRKNLQNIAIDHSADLDYKDLMEIYK